MRPVRTWRCQVFVHDKSLIRPRRLRYTVSTHGGSEVHVDEGTQPAHRMTRNRWLLVLLAVAALGGTLVVTRRGPARVAVEVGAITRQARFRSTVTASGELVAMRYADIGSSVMGKI